MTTPVWNKTRPNGNWEIYNPDAVGRLPLNVGSTDKKAGTPVKVGAFVGVLETDSDGGAAAGITTNYKPGYGSVALKGVFLLKVLAGSAVTQGAKVYIKDDGTLTTVATGNSLFGLLYQSAMANGDDKHVAVYLLGYTG